MTGSFGGGGQCAGALCRRLREAWDDETLPILAFTDPSPEAIADALAAGANDCLDPTAVTALLAARLRGLLCIQQLKAVTSRSAAANEARFRGIADRLPQLMWMARADGTLEYANEAWRAYVGWRCSAAEGSFPNRRSIFAVVHPEDADAFAARWARCMERQEELEQVVRLRRQDGAFRWHAVQARPMGVVRARGESWLGTCVDIDALKRAETAAREAKQCAAEAGRLAT